MAERRELGDTGIRISPVALGCWPISGMTSLDVNERDSLATIEACFHTGVNFLDTAYGYGVEGESERLIARALRGRRDEMVIATKVGMHWNEQRQREFDARPQTIRRECEESLLRLNTDCVELLYLHAPDGRTPLAEAAGEMLRLRDQGKARAIGASNFTVEQLEQFHSVCPLSAYQPPYNMLQRQIEKDTLPWCRARNVSVMVYWPLMKGLLAGRLGRDHQFAPGDGRAKYPMFQGDEWRRNQDFVDQLREVADELGKSVAQVVINWTIHQPGVTAALCGAKRPSQLRENAGGMGWRLPPEQLRRIERALEARGEAVVKPAV